MNRPSRWKAATIQQAVEGTREPISAIPTALDATRALWPQTRAGSGETLWLRTRDARMRRRGRARQAGETANLTG